MIKKMETKSGTKTLEINGYKFFLDGYLYNNLNIVKYEAIPNKWDGLIIVHGKEGTGKTTLAAQAALYLSNDFNIDYVAWKPGQFTQIIDDAKPESSILWDEAITGARASQWADNINQTIVQKLTMIRKKKLKILICFPYLWMLDKYFVSRCLASIYVYSKGFEDRGHAFAYNQEQTEYLYAMMKEKYRLNPSAAFNACYKSFFFRFDKRFVLPEKEYDKRKTEATKNLEPDKDIWRDHCINTWRYIREHPSIIFKDMCRSINLTDQYVYRVMKQTELIV